MIIVGGVSVPIMESTLEGDHIDLAKKETEKLASDLLKTDGKLLRLASVSGEKLSKDSRSIASIDNKPWEGQFGSDPWGKPYHFRFLKNQGGAPVQLVVWSDGPGKRVHQFEVRPSTISGVEEINFDKSDVVVSKVSLR